MLRSVLLVSAALASLTLPAARAHAQAPAARPAPSASPAPRDWTTWGYDPQRSSWNRGETELSTRNVGRLRLQWTAQLSTPPRDVVLSTATAPLVVEGVATPTGAKDLVVVLGADDTLSALDARDGKLVWSKSYGNPVAAKVGSTWLCSNTANATPVIDKAKGIVYFTTSDGMLRGLSLADGAERLAPTDFVAPFSRNWSLNLIGEVIYTTTARGCGEVQGPAPGVAATPISTTAGATAGRRGPPYTVEPGSVSAMDISDPAHPKLTRFYTSGGRSSGPWTRGGVVAGPGGTVIAQTADGVYDPAAGEFGESILELAPKATRLLDSFTPANWRYMNTHDLDLGSTTPAVFSFHGRELVAISSKESSVYLLDAADLGGGGADHGQPLFKSPQLGNQDAAGEAQGVWGALSNYEAPDGRRFLYVPLWGPPAKSAPQFPTSNGPVPHGSLMAFEVVQQGEDVKLVPAWSSGDMYAPEPAAIANGVVFAMQTGEQTMQHAPHAPGTPRYDDRAPISVKFRATPVSHIILYAYDAETGRKLYSSKDAIPGWTHFSEPVVALGKVFIATHDGKVYAFGLRH